MFIAESGNCFSESVVISCTFLYFFYVLNSGLSTEATSNGFYIDETPPSIKVKTDSEKQFPDSAINIIYQFVQIHVRYVFDIIPDASTGNT
jgi:hypothetical protein